MHRTPATTPHDRAGRLLPGLALAAVLAACLGLAACGGDDGAQASNGPPPIADLDAEGEFLVDRFFTVLAAGEREGVAAVLSPAFQIVRSTGTVHDRDGYLADLPTVGEFTFSDVRATLSQRVLVVSYVVHVEEVLEGVEQTTSAPRLSTFQWEGADWLLVSHANFGAIR